MWHGGEKKIFGRGLEFNEILKAEIWWNTEDCPPWLIIKLKGITTMLEKYSLATCINIKNGNSKKQKTASRKLDFYDNVNCFHLFWHRINQFILFVIKRFTFFFSSRKYVGINISKYIYTIDVHWIFIYSLFIM